MRVLRLLILSISCVVFPLEAVAQTTQTAARREFQEAYKQDRVHKFTLFGGAPSYHITPQRNSVSLALDSEVVDLAIAPDQQSLPAQFLELDHRLEMTGMDIAPMAAFFSRNFGVGLLGEIGDRQIQYVQRDRQAASFFEQFSQISYSGAGVYAFIGLPTEFMPTWLKGTFIGGGRTISVVHSTGGNRTDVTALPESERFKYGVQVYDGGLSLAIPLARRFAILPWGNYRQVVLGSIRTGNNVVGATIDPAKQDIIDNDRALIWQMDPAFTYGVDFSATFAKVELHLGGLLGYLASRNSGSDRVHDKSLSLAVGYTLNPSDGKN